MRFRKFSSFVVSGHEPLQQVSICKHLTRRCHSVLAFIRPNHHSLYASFIPSSDLHHSISADTLDSISYIQKASKHHHLGLILDNSLVRSIGPLWTSDIFDTLIQNSAQYGMTIIMTGGVYPFADYRLLSTNALYMLPYKYNSSHPIIYDRQLYLRGELGISRLPSKYLEDVDIMHTPSVHSTLVKHTPIEVAHLMSYFNKQSMHEVYKRVKFVYMVANWAVIVIALIVLLLFIVAFV
jgi:hypothetical protein